MNTLKTFFSYFYEAMVGFTIFAVFAFSMSWMYYNFLDGYSLPTIVEPIPILNPNHEVAIGEEIVMELNIIKPQEIALVDNDVSITCDDSNLITLQPAPTAGTIPVGEFTFISSSYRLPAKATIGSTCVFNFLNVYRVNPYVEEIVIWTSEEFKVTKGAE